MTIRLLSAYSTYPANAIVTLDAATEAGLIAAKQASANTAGGAAYFPSSVPKQYLPAKLVFDGSGNVLGFSGLGESVITFGGTVITKPDAPTGLTLTAGANAVSAAFAMPVNTGGNPITHVDVILSNGAKASGTTSPITIATPSGIAVTATAFANNGIFNSIPSTLSGSVTPGSSTPVAPIFTVPPTLNASPVVNASLSVVAGTFTGTATSQIMTIYRDGVDVGNNYTVQQRDLKSEFQAFHMVSNSAGIDAAVSSLSARASQDPTLAPAFSSVNDVTGFCPLPQFMGYEAVAGSPIRLYGGQVTTGASYASMLFEVETGVGTNVWATGAGTAVTSPYRGYTPTSGEATPPGRRLRATITLGGTGSTPAPTWTCDPVPIRAAAAATGALRFISTANRLNLFAQTNVSAQKCLTNHDFVIGSGATTGGVIDLSNLIANIGTNVVSGPGFTRRLEAIDAVYVSAVGTKVFAITFGGVVPSASAPVIVADGATQVRSDAFTWQTAFQVAQIPAGDKILVRARWDLPANTVISVAEAGDDITNPAEHYYTNGTTITVDVGSSAGNRLVTASGSVSLAGPTVMLLGTFASGDPKVPMFVGDSRVAQQGIASLGATTFNAFRNALLPTFAGATIARSGGNMEYYLGSAALQAYAACANIFVSEMGINGVPATANIGNADYLIGKSQAMWAAFQANALTTAGLRTPAIIQLSLMFHFQATNADSSAYSNALSSSQTPYPQMGLGGDVQQFWVPAMQAGVAAGTIAAFIDGRSRMALSGDPTSLLFYKTRNSYYADALHQANSRVMARQIAENLLALA